MKTISFSIIVPVYNAEKYLKECIDSILKQTYSEFELLLIDDGSVDRSSKICDSYADSDSRVKVFHKENAGQLHTREFGIKHASNEWIVFVDADDYIENNALEILVDNINRYDCECVIFGFREFDEKNKNLKSTSVSVSPRLIIEKSDMFKLLLFEPGHNVIWRKAVKKFCFGNRDYSPFYQLRIAEDRLQSADVFYNTNSVLLIDDVLYNYRLNENGVMNTRSLDSHTNLVVDEIILHMLKHDKIFSDDDYIVYRSIMINSIVFSIFTIAVSVTSRLELLKLYKKMRNEKFYNGFILSGKYDKHLVKENLLIYWLFKYKLDSTIGFIGYMHNKIKSLIKLLKLKLL